MFKTNLKIAEAIKKDYPEVLQSTRINVTSAGSFFSKVNDKVFEEKMC